MDSTLTAARVATLARDFNAAMGRVIQGKPDAVEMTLVVLLSGGHLLIEDVPGVGKTMLARTLATVLDCTARRIQFTADLLPSDITGVSVFNPQTRDFEFKPGGVFANVVIADEINRASPKTQSALLEAMEEQRVSVDGTTYDLPRPFMVVATQNPVEMQGTYPLPEAQRDRFTAAITMGYPDSDAEADMMDAHVSVDPLEELTPVASGVDVLAAVGEVRGIFVHAHLKAYAIEILRRTREDARVGLGASPRAGLQWIRAAKARAAIRGRGYVIPEDIASLAVPVLGHRLILSSQTSDRHATSAIVQDLVAQVPAPRRG